MNTVTAATFMLKCVVREIYINISNVHSFNLLFGSDPNMWTSARIIRPFFIVCRAYVFNYTITTTHISRGARTSWRHGNFLQHFVTNSWIRKSEIKWVNSKYIWWVRYGMVQCPSSILYLKFHWPTSRYGTIRYDRHSLTVLCCTARYRLTVKLFFLQVQYRYGTV